MTFLKVCALVLVGVLSYLGIFYVSVGMLDNIFLMFLPLLFGYLYLLWVVPSRQILLQGLEEVCIIYIVNCDPKRCILLNFSFQHDPHGFSCWIATAFIHFIFFWTLTWSDISWCNLTPICFLGLLLLIPQIIVWAAAHRVSR